MVQGTVTETMDAGRYTYMHVETSDGLVWVAATHREVVVGQSVRAAGIVMEGFDSPTLGRRFREIVLAANVELGEPPASTATEGEAPRGVAESP